MLSIAQKLILATLLTWPLLCGLASAQTFFLPNGAVAHQVTTTSNAQALTASCDPSVGVTEWDFLLSHSFTAPTITFGAGCRNSQQLIVRVIQDATGGIAPSLAAASGVTISWQANGGSQPSLTTTANAADLMRFTLSTYPSGTNLILTSWLPNTVPSLAAVGSPCTNQVVTALGSTGPTCSTVTSADVDTSVGTNVFNVSTPTNFGTPITGPVTIVANTAATEALTITTAGTISTLGVGCSAVANTATVTINYTSPNGSAKTATPTALSITGNGPLTTQQLNSTPIVVGAGTAITYSIASNLGSGGCTTTPQYTFYFHTSL